MRWYEQVGMASYVFLAMALVAIPAVMLLDWLSEDDK